MDIETEARGSTLLIAVGETRIDAAIAVTFKETMRELTAAHSGRVLLDLSRVTFIDSSGLGAVVGAMKQLPATAVMELAGLTGAVAKVFKLTRMDTVFTIHASAAEALSAGHGAA